MKTNGILEQRLIEVLHSREHPKTICPSEVPRTLSNADLGTIGVSDWKALMDPVRTLLFEMRTSGQVEILQKGEVVSPGTALGDIRGPIRARLARSNEA